MTNITTQLESVSYQKSRSNRAMSILACDDSLSSYQKPCSSTRTSQTAQTVGFMSDSECSSKTIKSVFSKRIRRKKKKNKNKNTADIGSKLPYVSSRYDHLEYDTDETISTKSRRFSFSGKAMPLFERDRNSHVVPNRAILGRHPHFDDRDQVNREVKTNRRTKFREILFRRKKSASDISTAPPLISPVSTLSSNGSASQHKNSSFMSKYRKDKNETKVDDDEMSAITINSASSGDETDVSGRRKATKGFQNIRNGLHGLSRISMSPSLPRHEGAPDMNMSVESQEVKFEWELDNDELLGISTIKPTGESNMLQVNLNSSPTPSESKSLVEKIFSLRNDDHEQDIENDSFEDYMSARESVADRVGAYDIETRENSTMGLVENYAKDTEKKSVEESSSTFEKRVEVKEEITDHLLSYSHKVRIRNTIENTPDRSSSPVLSVKDSDTEIKARIQSPCSLTTLLDESPHCMLASELESIGAQGEVCGAAPRMTSEEKRKIFQLRVELENVKKYASKLEKDQLILLCDNETLARGQVQCEMKMREVNFSYEVLNDFTKNIGEKKVELELQLKAQHEREEADKNSWDRQKKCLETSKLDAEQRARGLSVQLCTLKFLMNDSVKSYEKLRRENCVLRKHQKYDMKTPPYLLELKELLVEKYRKLHEDLVRENRILQEQLKNMQNLHACEELAPPKSSKVNSISAVLSEVYSAFVEKYLDKEFKCLQVQEFFGNPLKMRQMFITAFNLGIFGDVPKPKNSTDETFYNAHEI